VEQIQIGGSGTHPVNQPPTVTLSTSERGEVSGAFEITLTWSEPITGFAVLDPDGLPVSTAVLSDPFAFVNHTMQTFFSQETMIKIAGLLFASPVGWLFIILIFWGINGQNIPQNILLIRKIL